ncbi:CDP-alcohol phosphatidyltransferase family protein [Psychroflexus halocasei]|uniref:CDP-diacylglycerol---serine O-phosphatidyltransferase n=1 Tax=Psychroflexus halocasei TaxID=908615 RepID=A0A1H3YVF0_9FLAO|nr:CDP-alcohol phosphatidyltransferase family protein [Psychroflexus halocasei]SEA15377.1 CDP-diacylglycerol---serine O-phosphatidyltransferase [Psychroflexus halocasei]
MKKHIPNLITFGNLFAGSIACLYAFQADFLWAFIFMFIGIFFDFFDGMAARILDVKSELGLQLDSLADMVTSGLVPGIVMFHLIGKSVNPDFSFQEFDFASIDVVALFGFLITLGSAYRLAKFNIDMRQTDAFIGLPTPANAIFITSLAMSIQDLSFLQNVYVLCLISVLSYYILNAEIKLIALKFKNLNFKENWYRFLLILISVVLIISLQFLAVPMIIAFYIILSIIISKKEA